MKKYSEACFTKTIKPSFLQRKKMRGGVGDSWEGRHVGEFEGKIGGR